MPLDTAGGREAARLKQLRLPWSQCHTDAALDALVLATCIPRIVGQQQPGSEAEAEEFPLSWNPLPGSDILLPKGLPPALLCLGRPPRDSTGHVASSSFRCCFLRVLSAGVGGGGDNEPALWPRLAECGPRRRPIWHRQLEKLTVGLTISEDCSIFPQHNFSMNNL